MAITKSKALNKNVFWIILILIFLVKLITIRNSEVLAQPNDSVGYIKVAAEKVWFNPIVNLSHPPGYSLFIILSNLFGLPLRLSQELLYFLSIGFLLYGLRCLKVARIICIVVFLILAFHPFTYHFLSLVMTEGITSSLYNFLIAFTLILVTKKLFLGKLAYSSLCGITLGFIFITRPENLIIYLYIFLVLVLITFKYKKNLQTILKNSLYFGIIPLFIASLMSLSISSLNEIFLGVPGLSFPTTPNFQAMISNIAKIDYPSSQQYIKISRDQLEAAYQVSPSLKKLKPFIEEEYQQKVEANTKVVSEDDFNNELRTDQVSWSINASIRNSLDKPTLTNRYEITTQINNELKTALKEGKLPSQKIFIKSLDPRFNVWIPHLKQSIIKVTHRFIFPPMKVINSLSFDDDSRIKGDKYVISLYNRMANRRISIIGTSNTNLKKGLSLLVYGIYVINIVGIISFIFLFAYYIISQQKSYFLSQYYFIVLIILCLVASRLLLYSVADASAFPNQIRYLFALMPLFSGISLLNIAVCINLLRKKIFKKVAKI